MELLQTRLPSIYARAVSLATTAAAPSVRNLTNQEVQYTKRRRRDVLRTFGDSLDEKLHSIDDTQSNACSRKQGGDLAFKVTETNILKRFKYAR